TTAVGAHGDAPAAESSTTAVGAHGNAPAAESSTTAVGAHGNAPAAESSTTTEPTPTAEASAEATDGMDADDATYADLPTAATAEPKQLDNTIARHRAPFEVLTERMIGEASRAVRFDWRRKTVGIGAIGSQLLELNNFWSARVGGFARVPFSSLVTEVAVTWVFTRGSESTERLALTPYRQVGRPSRLELDVNVGFPVAEGVATAWPSFLPPLELVFSLDVGFRYIYYPGALSGAGFREVAGAIFSPQLNDRELENLEEDRLPAMEVDGGRYNLLAGGSLDLYFQSGFFLSPRVMVALPIMSQFTGSGLGWWWELSLGLGWMF
ncbi:MAG: hypothetical protein ACOX6T_05665, partial [Myxococcales bacterium]